jgi:aminopeptidase YwaD
VHLDMVGGDPAATKAIFHVTRGPGSLPSFVYDVGAHFGELANRETTDFAGTGVSRLNLHSPEGGKEALQAALVEFTSGSDHQVYTEGSFRIPAIYMNDWPDRYIHTNFDTPANIDPSKLKRAAFIAATSGYFLAQADARHAAALGSLMQSAALQRGATVLQRRAGLSATEGANLARFQLAYEREVLASLDRFLQLPADVRTAGDPFLRSLSGLVGAAPQANTTAATRTVYQRNPQIKGPLTAFGYDYLVDKLGAQPASQLQVLRFNGLRASGADYAYEILNLVNGQRSAQQIRDDVSAIFGPIPLEHVTEFLTALEKIQVIQSAPAGNR